MKPIEIARLEGLVAGKEGKPSSSCPYGKDTAQERILVWSWTEGWKEGSRK